MNECWWCVIVVITSNSVIGHNDTMFVNLTATVPILTTNATNSKISTTADMLSSYSFEATKTMSVTNASFVTHVTISPIVNTTSLVKSPYSSANFSMMHSSSKVVKTSIITTNATNSVVSNIANMSFSNMSAVMPTISVVNTTFTTHVRTLPVLNMTSLVKSPSYSPATFSMIHLSSTTVVTPVTPQIVLARIIIDANCSQVPTHQSTDFKAAIRLACSKVLNISATKINISAVTCGSIIVDMKIENVNNENITQKLANAVDKKQLNISYKGAQLVVTSVKKLFAVLMTSTVAATSSISINSLKSHFMSSNNSVGKTLSGSLPSSSMLFVNKSVSARASMIMANVTNSMVSTIANLSSSNMSAVMPPTSVVDTTFVTRVRTSPVVNMTNLVKSSSYSPTTFSMTQLLSSPVVTPVTPEIVLARVIIDANCSQVPAYQSTVFKDAIRLACSKVLNISATKINISAVTCGSIIVDMKIENVKNENVIQKLEDAVREKQLNISYNGTQFLVISAKKLTPIPVTSTVAATSFIFTDSSTSHFMSSIYNASKTSGSLSRETVSRVQSNSSMIAVNKSVSVTASILATDVTNSTVSTRANTSSYSSAVMQTMSVDNTTFVIHVSTSPVVNMTISVKSAYSPTISSMIHSSSSEVITPVTPKIVLVRITINANCSQVPTYQSTDFKYAVRLACSNVLNISVSKVNISAVTCGSIIVDMMIENVHDENITQKLTDAVDKKQLNVSYNGAQLAVTSVSRLNTIPVAATTLISKISSTSYFMSSVDDISKTSGSLPSETISQVLPNSSMLPVNKSIVTTSIITSATNSTVPTTVNMSFTSSAVKQTMSVTNATFVPHVITSSVVNMTILVEGLSYSPTISSLAHSSSSQVVTPVTPDIVLVRITIGANCSQVPTYQSTDFKHAVQLACSQVLNIPVSKINISAVICGSIIVDMMIENVHDENITQKLTDAVDKKQLNISYNGAQLAVTSVSRLTTIPATTTMAATTLISKNSSTSHFMSSINGVSKTSGFLLSKTISQVLSNSSMLPANESVVVTMSIMTTSATNSTVPATVNMFSHSLAINQTMSVINATFATQVTTSPVINMTSSVERLSYFSTISSLVYSSSSQAVTPITPEIVLVRITIDANCSQIPTHQSTDFKDAVRYACVKVLNISASRIDISAVICGSIIVNIKIENVNNENVTQKLSDAVDKKELNISYNGTQFAVTSVTKLTTISETSIASSPSPVVMVTSSMERLSYSPTMTLLAHSSSSQAVTPSTPETVLVRMIIDANCSQITYRSIIFKNAVRFACSKVLGISTSRITISSVTCGSIIVYMTIENVNNENIFQKLHDAVEKNQLNVTYNGTQLAVISVKQISSKEPDDNDNTALIIYIVFGSVLGLAFLIGMIVLVVRCRHERSTGMFHIPSEENLELSGFSGTNKSYRGGNFYGELQPSTNDGVSGGGVVNKPDSMATDFTGDTENGGSFGAGYLPAWKNLPTMDMSEVSLEDNANQVNDNLLLMYGKTGTDEGNDSGKTITSFDNIGAV